MTKTNEEELEDDKELEREPVTVNITDIELESIRREAADYKNKYLRQLAELENTRKRLMKERDDLSQHASRNVIAEFLTPIDQMENALKFAKDMSDEVKHWALGFEMILSHFKDVLTNYGITPMKTEGQLFDPHHHHVTETVETDEYPPGTIIKEILRGYVRGDQVVRPAHVTIAKTKNFEESRPENQDEENIEE
ncbi:MAG: Protein GrpE [Chlamydiae bacterium]|nr:Protein GrpE [Chlamydiota bacterium]